MGLPEYLEVLRRRWRLVAAVALVGLLGGLAATLVGAQRTATTTLIISADAAGAELTQQRLTSYVALATSPRVAGAVAADLDEGDVAAVREDLDARADPASLLLVITARDRVGALATAKATSAARQLVALVAEVDPGAPPLAVAQPAVLEPDGAAVSAVSGALLGAALGLAGGAALALVRDAGDRRLRGVPVLTGALSGTWSAEVALDARRPRSGRSRGRVVPAERGGQAAEGFRRLRAAVLARAGSGGDRTLLVAGCQGEDGAGAVAHGLALAMARGGLRVVLVDAHLRGSSSAPALVGAVADRPGSPAERAARAERHRGVADVVRSLEEGRDGRGPRGPGGPDDGPDGWPDDGTWPVQGLRGVLAGRVRPAEALVAGEDPRLAVLPAGAPAAEAGELLASAAMLPVLAALHREADVVVIDAPPVLPWADAAALTSLAGCEALLVARQHRTRERDAAAALAELHRSRPASLGLVLLTGPPGRSR